MARNGWKILNSELGNRWFPIGFIGAKGGVYPAQALWNGIREGEGKGLRRTGVRRAAAAAPGPGRGGRVLANGMRSAEPVLNGALRSSGFPLDQCTFLADSGQVIR